MLTRILTLKRLQISKKSDKILALVLNIPEILVISVKEWSLISPALPTLEDSVRLDNTQRAVTNVSGRNEGTFALGGYLQFVEVETIIKTEHRAPQYPCTPRGRTTGHPVCRRRRFEKRRARWRWGSRWSGGGCLAAGGRGSKIGKFMKQKKLKINSQHHPLPLPPPRRNSPARPQRWRRKPRPRHWPQYPRRDHLSAPLCHYKVK